MAKATEELKERRSKIKKVIAQNHPDATGGDFEDDEQKRRYEDAMTALDELDTSSSPTSRALATALESQGRQLTALVEEQQKALVEIERGRRMDTATKEIEKRIQDSSVARNRPFKWSGFGLAGFGVLLISLKEPFEKLADIMPPGTDAGPYGALGALLGIELAVAGALLVFFAQRRQDRETRRKQNLLTETGFREFIHSHPFAAQLQLSHNGNFPDIVSIEGIARAVEEFGNLSDPIVAQEVAELTAEKLVARHLAEQMDGPWLSPTLKLVHGLAEELEIGLQR